MTDTPVAPQAALEALGFTLPLGVLHQGVLLKDFELTPPRGSIRSEMANASGRGGSSLAALRHVMLKLGQVDRPNLELLQKLTLVDVDYIHFVCSARRGKGVIPVILRCGTEDDPESGCGHKIETDVTCSNIELKAGTLPVLHDPKTSRAYQVFDFQDPVEGRAVSVKIAITTLGEQSNLLSQYRAKGAKEGDVTFKFLVDRIIDWDGTGKGITLDALRELPLDTLDAFVAGQGAHYPTQLDTEVIVGCPKCGREHTTELEVDHWLAPLAPPKVSTP